MLVTYVLEYLLCLHKIFFPCNVLGFTLLTGAQTQREGSSHDERRVRVREQLFTRESLRGRGQQRNDAGRLPHLPLRGEHRDLEPAHRHDRQQDRGALQEGRSHTAREDRRPGPYRNSEIKITESDLDLETMKNIKIFCISVKVKGIEDIVTDKKTLLGMLPASIRNKLLEMTRLFTYLENLKSKGNYYFHQL